MTNMKTYIYLSDIHSNYEALKHINDLPEMNDPSCEFRFGGDYIDGYDLQPNATLNTLHFVKDLCEKGKAKAILGNHDQFLLDAAYYPYRTNYWELNGRASTLENLGIPYTTNDELPEQLLYHLKDELEWLNNLPYVVQDENILLTNQWILFYGHVTPILISLKMKFLNISYMKISMIKLLSQVTLQHL